MTLDTISASIPLHVVPQYLKKLDDRGEAYGFNVLVHSVKSIMLELTRDGCEDALTLMLNIDGTWSAGHVLVVGEKQ